MVKDEVLFFVRCAMAFRKSVNKARSAGQFRKNVGKTKAANMRAAPMRGGIRL